eukprot:3556528-Prymnesium_polylepis.1
MGREWEPLVAQQLAGKLSFDPNHPDTYWEAARLSGLRAHPAEHHLAVLAIQMLPPPTKGSKGSETALPHDTGWWRARMFPTPICHRPP